MDEIGLKIKRLRIHNGLSQKELLEGKFSTTYLSRVENLELQPSDKFLEFIVDKFAIKKKTLRSQESRSEQEEKLASIYRIFKDKGTISEEDFLYLIIHQSQSYSSKTYLQMYSVFIRYYLNKNDLTEAKKAIHKSASFGYDNNSVQDLEFEQAYGYYLISCGNYYYEIQNFIKADECYTRAEELNLGITEHGRLLFNMSLIKERIIPENLRVSLYYSDKAYKVFVEQKLEYEQNLTFIIQAVQNYGIGNFEKAETLLNKAYKYMEATTNTKMLAKIEYNKGNLKQLQGNYRKALEHYYREMEYLHQIDSEKSWYYVYRNLSKVFLELNELADAGFYMNKAFETINKDTQPYFYNEILSIKGEFLLRKGEDKQYECLTEKIISDCLNRNFNGLAKKLSKELGSHFYKKNKNRKSAKYLMLALNLESNMKGEVESV
ncbi:MAG TPA: helix-turn-helix transcriptional regulator [Bacillales bacterium]|nr:helix-turn-helix transcriptional regulator [Bacillales bacterium]